MREGTLKSCNFRELAWRLSIRPLDVKDAVASRWNHGLPDRHTVYTLGGATTRRARRGAAATVTGASNLATAAGSGLSGGARMRRVRHLAVAFARGGVMMDVSRGSRTCAVFLAVAALLSLSCGGGGPSSSTPVTTVPVTPTATPPAAGLEDMFHHANCALG